MLLITSDPESSLATGGLALNSVWGVEKNRSSPAQLRRYRLALLSAVGVLMMLSVSIGLRSGRPCALVKWVFFGHTQNFVFAFLAGSILRVVALAASSTLFFLIYYILPYP